MRAHLTTLLALHLVVATAQAATETVSVADFGVHPNSRRDAVPGVQKALAACRGKEDVVLVFPKGRYDFRPQHAEKRVYYESNSYDNNPKTCAILIESFKGLTVDGSESEFVFHGRMQPFTVEGSERVTIRNVAIDWDIPLTAQAEVAGVGDDYIDLRINTSESPYVIEDGKIAFIENESMHTFARGIVRAFKPLSTTDFEVTLDAPAPDGLEKGDALENLTWSPDVEIRNCKFGSCRARGLLVTTPGRVVIEKNVFESSGSAILISGDANGWYESGAVRDVLIRGNTFKAPCMTNLYQFCDGIISVLPIVPAPGKAPEPFHRNIRIEENVFHPFDYPVLYAKSVDGLTFSNNRIVRSTRYRPYHRRKHMLNLEYCRRVTVAGNRLEGDVLGRDIHIENMDRSEVTLAPGQGISGPGD